MTFSEMFVLLFSLMELSVNEQKVLLRAKFQTLTLDIRIQC